MIHRRVVRAWFVVALAIRCGGRDEAATTPAPEPGGSESTEGSVTGRAAAPAAGSRPCDGYVAEAMRCAREEAAARDEPLPDDAEVLEGYLREGCRTWLREGVSTGDLAAALRVCKTVNCAEGGSAWSECVVAALPQPAPTPAGGGIDPSSWSRIEPRPFDTSREACDVMVDWMVQCVREAAGAGALGPDGEATFRSGFAQACDAWKSVPALAGALPGVLRKCADVGCGPGGGDLMVCIAYEVSNAAAAAAGAPEPAPEPATEAAPESEPEP